jgi:hypothetical protein
VYTSAACKGVPNRYPHKNATSRKDMQDINSPLEPCHELAIVSSKVTESLRFLLKDIDDGVGIICDLDTESMSCDDGEHLFSHSPLSKRSGL